MEILISILTFLHFKKQKYTCRNAETLKLILTFLHALFFSARNAVTLKKFVALPRFYIHNFSKTLVFAFRPPEVSRAEPRKEQGGRREDARGARGASRVGRFSFWYRDHAKYMVV